MGEICKLNLDLPNDILNTTVFNAFLGLYRLGRKQIEESFLYPNF